MSEKARIKIALGLVAGILLVVLLPAVQLLPASTRAWRRAKTLLVCADWLARVTSKLPAVALASSISKFLTPDHRSKDTAALECVQLC